MSSNTNIEKMVEGTFGAFSRADWCPYAVQGALATDCIGILGKDGGSIALQNVIAAREVAATVAEGFSIRREIRGTPPCHTRRQGSQQMVHERD